MNKFNTIAESVLKESSMWSIIDPLITQINEMLNYDKTFFRFEESERVWTRGDGSRYKEWNKIHIPWYFKEEYNWDNIEDDINKIWEYILTLPGVRPLDYKISDEFPSNSPYEVVKYKGLLFKKGTTSIDVGTPSRLRGAVWKKRY